MLLILIPTRTIAHRMSFDLYLQSFHRGGLTGIPRERIRSSGAENGIRAVRHLRKTGVVGRDELAKSLVGKKIPENHPNSP